MLDGGRGQFAVHKHMMLMWHIGVVRDHRLSIAVVFPDIYANRAK